MKKAFLIAGATIAGFLTTSALAFSVGVVDMQQVFSSKHGLSSIQGKLESKFSGQRANMIKMMKQLQADQKAISKNKSVMSASDLAKKQASLKAEQAKFQTAQAQYQKAVMGAQAKAMKDFVGKIKIAAAGVAKSDKLDAVFVSNSVLYADSSKDVTSDVLGKLK